VGKSSCVLLWKPSSDIWEEDSFDLCEVQSTHPAPADWTPTTRSCFRLKTRTTNHLWASAKEGAWRRVHGEKRLTFNTFQRVLSMLSQKWTIKAETGKYPETGWLCQYHKLLKTPPRARMCLGRVHTAYEAKIITIMSAPCPGNQTISQVLISSPFIPSKQQSFWRSLGSTWGWQHRGKGLLLRHKGQSTLPQSLERAGEAEPWAGRQPQSPLCYWGEQGEKQEECIQEA
jgi:hypothetical protein